MDIKKYIESGVLESYIFGELDRWQSQEVESLREVHPEIHEALVELELGLEVAITQNYSKKPSPKVKNKLMDELFKEESQKAAPSKSKVKSIQQPVQSASPSFKISQVISIAAAITGIVWGGLQQMNSKELKTTINQYQRDLVEITQSKSDLVNRVSYMENHNTNLERYLEHINRKSTHLVEMKSEDLSKMVKMYWCENSKVAVLKVVNLPKLRSDQDYQLWRLVDGKPLDMGLIGEEYMVEDNMLTIPDVEEADAFAITIEPKGGRPTPSLNNLQVISEI